MEWLPLLCAFGLAAALYSSVGHGGASGYLAVMALAGFAPVTMKPTALVLNLIVSLVGTVLFIRAGLFAWRLFWPFAVVSIPFAWIGGSLSLGHGPFRLLVAVVLGFAALRLVLPEPPRSEIGPPPVLAVIAAGSVIGLLSGLIGVGGGIFLTPLLLLCRWAEPRTAAAVSAPFIFVNSAAGLGGHFASLSVLPDEWPWFAAAVLVGGLCGARWGSRIAEPLRLRHALAAVLVVASAKLFLV